jgi:hypothetical protein
MLCATVCNNISFASECFVLSGSVVGYTLNIILQQAAYTCVNKYTGKVQYYYGPNGLLSER